jgi:hypothetical protein
MKAVDRTIRILAQKISDTNVPVVLEPEMSASNATWFSC